MADLENFNRNKVLSDLQDMRDLEKNWDGYGSKPICNKVLNIAFEIEKMLDYTKEIPQVCPISGGGIKFDFQGDSKFLEIEIFPDGHIEYLHDWKEETCNFEEIEELLKNFYR